MMSTKSELKQALFKAYDGFGDKRLKKIENDAPFIIDDRGPGDYGADKQLFPWFCLMFADVVDGSTVRITMRGGLPTSPSVNSWFASTKAEDYAGGVQFHIASGEQDTLLQLADRIEAIVAPGKSYAVKAYKYVCPRVAHSLRELHKVLSSAWV